MGMEQLTVLVVDDDRITTSILTHMLDSYADKVIVDYPSGALFEAAKAGKSVLCVCADYFNIIKKAEAVFGKSLQPFSRIEDAISIIKEFLYANPDDYIVEIPSSDKDFISVFNQIVK